MKRPKRIATDFSPKGSQPIDNSRSASADNPTTPIATDDTNFVNDQGQTSGDIFTQNARDQSTA